MGSRSEEDGRTKAAGQPAGERDWNGVIEEDVFAKQEKVFTDTAGETPPALG